MREPTLAQKKVLQMMRDGCKLLFRRGPLRGAWLVEEDLSCIPIRPQTFNGLLIRNKITSVGPSNIFIDHNVTEYVIANEGE